jgi:choline dehydrogenase
MRPRAVIVGAGSAGSVLAARIAGRYDVVVIEAGRGARPLDPRRGLAESGTPPTWSLPAQLTQTRTWNATPGRAVGGSSVVNGGYFEAPDRADLELWHAAGGAAWEPERVLSHVLDIAERLGVHPSPQSHPIAEAFAAAAADLGCAGGLLPLRTTFADGVPRNVADVYLTGSSTAAIVRSDCRALRIVIEGGRATGVDVADGRGVREVIPADEVILCGGGFGTARLLLASGLGPADQFRAAGIDPVADLPGVGAAFSDHPTVWVEWMPTAALSAYDVAAAASQGAFPLALQLGADGGEGNDLEILPCLLPPQIAVRAAADPITFGVIVGLQRPVARGTVVAASAHPLAPARIDYGYLADPTDRAALRSGVRRAAELLSSRAFAGLVDRLVDLDDAVLVDDRRLDEWIADRLGSAAHTCGTAPMGSDADPLAVVDGAGRVRGIEGLRVADTSLLPRVPVRGPAAAAMAVGAIIADQMV